MQWDRSSFPVNNLDPTETHGNTEVSYGGQLELYEGDHYQANMGHSNTASAEYSPNGAVSTLQADIPYSLTAIYTQAMLHIEQTAWEHANISPGSHDVTMQ